MAIVVSALMFLFLFTAHRAWKTDDLKRRRELAGTSAMLRAEEH